MLRIWIFHGYSWPATYAVKGRRSMPFFCKNIECRNGFSDNQKYCKKCKRAHLQENEHRWPQRYCGTEMCLNITKIGSQAYYCLACRKNKRILMEIVFCPCKSSECHRDEVGYVPRQGSNDWPHATVCICAYCEGQDKHDEVNSVSNFESEQYTKFCRRCDSTCLKLSK